MAKKKQEVEPIKSIYVAPKGSLIILKRKFTLLAPIPYIYKMPFDSIKLIIDAM